MDGCSNVFCKPGSIVNSYDDDDDDDDDDVCWAVRLSTSKRISIISAIFQCAATLWSD